MTPSLILLSAGFLVFASILASRVSDRVGVPALIVFLCIGMLAGSDGPGGIHFDNAWIANLVGTLSLAFILFSGGLDTNWRIIRPVLGRGIILSTFGVAITAVLVGLFAWIALDYDIMTGLLIGSIVSSTDAAAVFSVLRGRGVGLKGQLKPLLELESGSNDPMAVFLTLGVTQLLTMENFAWQDLIPAFCINMTCGVLVGLLAGMISVYLFNRIYLEYEGLYPVLSMSLVLLTFGLAESLKGNGFLAVYICGVMMNGSDFAFKRNIGKFHDGLAWLMQISMFLVLGLLVFPTKLPGIAVNAILIVGFLITVARPVAVVIGLWKSTFSYHEQLLIAWTGLRGAVPIVLATFPLIAGYEHSADVFNIVFFVVLTSVLVQGTLLMPVARLLNVDEPLASRPRYSLEIERRGQAQGETREIEVLPNMAIVGCTIADLDMPADVLILLIGRGDEFVVPRGQTQIKPYDTLLLLGKGPSLRAACEILLSPTPQRKLPAPEDPLASLPMTTEEKFLSKQVVVIGYGRVGRRICDALETNRIPFVVADQNRDIVEQLRTRGIPAVSGDASTAMVLVQAHVARASILVIATPNTLKAHQMIEIARIINPSIMITVRAQSENDINLLGHEQDVHVMLAEYELAENISQRIVNQMRPIKSA